ncbi:MAG: LCP family protein [Chloroflexota bacterium]|nr:LCP family protein [Chloroflexota bacterium]
MTDMKTAQRGRPTRRGRWFGRLIYWIALITLCIGIVVFGVRIVTAVIVQINDQNEIARRVPLIQATGTALAQTATPAGAAKVDAFGKRADVIAQIFATNTPTPLPAIIEPTLQPTAAPTLVDVTPRPLPTLFAYQGAEPGAVANGTLVPSPVPAVDRRGQDLINVLLLGNDGEITGEGYFGTDTMIIVSVNRTAGTVAMLSLPRDLLVYIPGFTMQRLNIAYIRGETGGWTDGGFGLLRQTIFYNLGINVHYYAMVDLSGFAAIVDAVGGVDVAVDCAIQNLPLIGAEVPAGAVRVNEDGEYVLPVGYYHLNGAESLWYARARDNSSDFDRGRRQQQVLRAVWRAARDNGLLLNAPSLWGQGSQYVRTNLAFEDLLSLVPIALNLDPARIEQFRFRRLYDTDPWQPPDGSYVQVPIYDHILEMLNDFYTAPTESQITAVGVPIRVWNGTTNENWDRIAAESLGWDGFAAVAAGAATEPSAQTLLIDYTGSERGSSRTTIAASLNIAPENVRIQPDPNRTVDYEVIIGTDYNSCDEPGILPVDPLPATN